VGSSPTPGVFINKAFCLYIKIVVIFMPVTKSAKKALKRSNFLRRRNLMFKNAMKKLIREYRKLVSEGKIEDAKGLLSKVYSAIDRCARRNIIHKNTAARKKARLAVKLS